VSERVVVDLEPVEVEQHQHERVPDVRLAEVVLDLLHEAPSIPKPRQRVGERLLAAALEQSQLLAEGEDGAPDHGGERSRSQHERKRAEPLEVVVDEEPESDRCEGRGQSERRPAFGADLRDPSDR